MKKNLVLLSVLLVPAMLLMGCACPTDDAVVATPVAPVVVQPTPTPTPAPVVDNRFTDEMIFFAFDSSALSNEAKTILKNKVDYMNANPGIKTQIAGYCDERGTAEYNMALGDRRANAAKKYMMDLGIASDRMSTISYGYEYPLDPAHTPAAWAKNRRAQFKITN